MCTDSRLFFAGAVDGVQVWLPVSTIAHMPPRTVDITGRLYARMCHTTGQPNFAA